MAKRWISKAPEWKNLRLCHEYREKYRLYGIAFIEEMRRISHACGEANHAT